MLRAPVTANDARTPLPAEAFAEFRARMVELRAEALAGRGGAALAGRTSDAHDAMVSAHAAGCLARWPKTRGRGRVALLAVGGYGRRQLSPGSDLDLVLLAEKPGSPPVRQLAESMLYPLWDAKVSVGHAVHDVEGLVAEARGDLRTRTMLLDLRFLAGDAALAESLRERSAGLRGERELAAFVDALAAELRQRHERFGATVYLLEPDVKLGRGGLRDLDIIRWALRARVRAPDFAEALGIGALSQPEHDALTAAREFHLRLRAALHARSARRNDRVTFDAQEECAQALGFYDEAEGRADPARAVASAAERLMSEYYRHARNVASHLAHVLARVRPSRVPDHARRAVAVAEGVARFDGAVCLASADELHRDPAVALRLIEAALVLGLPVASSSRSSVAAAAADAGWCERLRATPEAGRCFLRLLDSSHRVAPRDEGAVSGTADNAQSVLADLHDLGLLLALIPEFAAVTARVQHDVYHVYTVDVHSVAAVDRLHALSRGELSGDFALSSRLMATVDRRPVLLLATLLHDIGKGQGRAHSRVGADMAPAIAARLGLDRNDADDVAWLVQEHLTLYHHATRRDLSDPSTLAQVTSLVGEPWRLQALFLLTVADLSTTSPTAMTAWKARLLDELYVSADEALREQGGGAERQHESLVGRALERTAAGDGAVARWVRAMPTRYLLATPPRDVLRHAAALHDVRPGEPRLRLQALDDGAVPGLYEVLVHAPDRAGLLSDLTGLLFAHRLDIQRAEIHSVGPDVVDVFTVRHPDPNPRELLGLEARLAQQLDAVVAGRLDGDAVVAMMRGRAGGAARPEPSVEARVALHNDVSQDATVIEVFGRDRPGFLHTVARAHHRLGLEIRVAKVNTEGRRAADVFYVTAGDGAKVASSRFDDVKAALLQAVEAT